MNPPLTYSTLSEAVAWLNEATGRPWTENELLDAAAGYRIALHAGAPLSAKVQLMEFDLTEPTCFRLKAELGWRMAMLYPIHIAQLLSVGETESAHPAGEPRNDQECLFFSEPVRVTREMVRVYGEALREIVRRRSKDKRIAWYAERAKVAARQESRLQKATAETPMQEAPPSDWKEQARTIADELDGADAQLAALFDPVAKEQLEAMFPDDGRWAGYAGRAARNGLANAAREDRARFNPYRAAQWWMDRQAPAGWDWGRCCRKLANCLPARSLDSRHLLTGDFD